MWRDSCATVRIRGEADGLSGLRAIFRSARFCRGDCASTPRKATKKNRGKSGDENVTQTTATRKRPLGKLESQVWFPIGLENKCIRLYGEGPRAI